MEVQELERGLWRWSVAAADGAPVSSHYVETPDGIVLVDPLVPAVASGHAERFWHHLDRDVARVGSPVTVIVTSARHRRSAPEVQARYAGRPGCRVVEGGAPAGSLAGGARLLGPVPSAEGSAEWLLLLPSHGALVAGDALVGVPDGLRHRPEAETFLRGLLALPFERVLVSHGPSVLHDGRSALARALG